MKLGSTIKNIISHIHLVLHRWPSCPCTVHMFVWLGFWNCVIAVIQTLTCSQGFFSQLIFRETTKYAVLITKYRTLIARYIWNHHHHFTQQEPFFWKFLWPLDLYIVSETVCVNRPDLTSVSSLLRQAVFAFLIMLQPFLVITALSLLYGPNVGSLRNGKGFIFSKSSECHAVWKRKAKTLVKGTVWHLGERNNTSMGIHIYINGFLTCFAPSVFKVSHIIAPELYPKYLCSCRISISYK